MLSISITVATVEDSSNKDRVYVSIKSRYSDWLWAGRPKGRSLSPGMIKNFHFSTPSRLAPAQCVPRALTPGIKRPGREADHSLPTTAEVKKMWIYTFRMVGGGIQLGPLGTAPTNRPTVPTLGDYDDGEFGGMMIDRGNRSTRRKPAPVPLCSPQIPHTVPRRETGPPRWEASD
jgi:hypothetical protein